MKRKDIIIIGILCIVIGIGYIITMYMQKDNNCIEVYYQNELIETIDINKDGIYTYEGTYGTFNIEVKDQQYHAINVECPNHDCEHVGWVKLKENKNIVCVPNEIYVIQNGMDILY